jgi:hypothetical protein
MGLDKKDLANRLNAEPGKPVIRRGEGFKLSTEVTTTPAETETQNRTDATSHQRTDATSHQRTDATSHQRTDATSHQRTDATSHQRTDAAASKEPKRVNRGYKLREDLIKDCRRIALEEDKALYEVMETALEQYVARYKAKEKKTNA